MSKGNVKKILILRFSSLGDIVMTTAMIRCLRARFPHAQIDMVVREDFFDLIETNPHLNEKIVLNRKDGMPALWALRRRINATGYDLIYDAHRSLRTLILMPFLRAPHKAYYQKQYIRRNLSLLFKVNLFVSKKRFLEKFIEPVEPFGVVYDGLGPEMFLSKKGERELVAIPPVFLKEKTAIGVIPSAQWPGKRWPLESFRSTLERLVAETDLPMIVFGGKGDVFVADLVKGLPEDRVFSAQGKLSIAGSTSLMKKCRFVIANDTGLMHVADALQIPSILFLGPTSRELGCLPYHPQTEVLEKKLWCRPCSKNGQAPCIRRERYCLTLISVDEVMIAARRLLKSTGA